MGNVNGIASTMQSPSVRGTWNLGRLLAAWLAQDAYLNRIAQGQTATLELVPKGRWSVSAQEKGGGVSEACILLWSYLTASPLGWPRRSRKTDILGSKTPVVSHTWRVLGGEPYLGRVNHTKGGSVRRKLFFHTCLDRPPCTPDCLPQGDSLDNPS